ncbi:MAG: CapA family protein [Oscillospiraceae bacterium]|nr:CapA family protein [Oscillospiraceae bacterium]
MAFGPDEIKRRHAIREQRRQQQKREAMMLRLVIAVMVLAVAALGVYMIKGGGDGSGETVQTPQSPTVNQTAPSAGTEAPTDTPTVSPTDAPTEGSTEPMGPTTVIHLAAAGDLNINDATVAAGRVNNGYDYTDTFMDVASVFAEADLAVLNFEGSLVGAPYGTKTQSAPKELAQALRAMGVDLVQMANSCSVTHGVAGLATSLENIRAAGLEPLGAYGSAEEFQHAKGYTMVEVQGIRIAFVAFTKGVGGLSLPAGSEDCVNLLYTDYATTYQKIDKDGITAILSSVSAEKPDLTIALVHWGSEYKDLVTENQENIAELMQENGVDVILGTHSHMLHQIDYDPVTGQMTAFSLGDFFGTADRAGTEYSIILDLEITRDNASGDTRVTSYSYTPIYNLTVGDAEEGSRRVVRLREAMGAYQENALGKVSESVYKDMEHAMERIADRITPKKTEEE